MANLLTKIREGVSRRAVEVADGIYADEVFTRDTWQAAVATGRAFIATSDRITTDATNTHIVALVRNPADSGHLVTVMQVVGNIAPDAMTLGRITLNPTGGLPTTAYTPLNVKALAGGADASVGEFLANASNGGLTGGTPTDVRLTTHKGRNEIPLGMPLAPGTSVGVHIPLGLISAGDGSFAAYLIQEPL